MGLKFVLFITLKRREVTVQEQWYICSARKLIVHQLCHFFEINITFVVTVLLVFFAYVCAISHYTAMVLACNKHKPIGFKLE